LANGTACPNASGDGFLRIFLQAFKELSSDADLEYAMIVKVHRSGQGAKGGLFAWPLGVPEAA
jgi:hypothetical protein